MTIKWTNFAQFLLSYLLTAWRPFKNVKAKVMLSYQHRWTRFIIMSVRIFAKPGWVWPRWVLPSGILKIEKYCPGLKVRWPRLRSPRLEINRFLPRQNKYIFGLTRGCFKNNFILNKPSTGINEVFAPPTSLISFQFADENLNSLIKWIQISGKSYDITENTHSDIILWENI